MFAWLSKTLRVAAIQRIEHRIHAVQPAHVHIAKGMAQVLLFVFLGKLVGAVKEMAIAYRYGVSGVVDAYVFALTLVTWLPGVWQSVLTVVLVPTFISLPEQEKRLFFSELMGFHTIFGVVSALAIAVGLPFLVPHVFSDSSDEALLHAIALIKGLAPIAIFSMLGGLLFTRLLAEEQFINTLMESVPALCVFIAVLAWPNNGADFPISNPLLYGTLIGFGMYVGALWMLLIRAGISSCFRWTIRSAAWHTIWRGMGYMALGQLVIALAGPIDQIMAASLGEGAIATLSYANRVLVLILGLGATAIGRSVLPVLSKAISRPRNAWHLARRWAQLLLLLGCGGVVFAWWLAPWVINVLFARGAFTSADAVRVVGVFRYGLVQVPFYLSGTVIVQFLASYGKYRQIGAIAAAVTVIKVFANYILMKWMGVSGVALATGIMYMSSFVLCLLTGSRLVKGSSE